MPDKTTSPEAQPQKPARRVSPYIMIWVVLTGLSIVYLALLATNPTLVANALGSKPSGSEEQDQATAMLTSEMQQLRDSLAKVSTDLQTLKVDINSASERERDLLERVAALESPQAADMQKVAALASGQKPVATPPAKPQKLPGQLGAPLAAAQPMPPTAAPAAQVAKVQPPKKPAPAPQVAKTPAAPPVLEQPLDQLSLETGSVGTEAPVNFGPATVTPAQPQANTVGTPSVGTTVAAAAPTAAPAQAKSVGIQIASGPSVQSLRLSWTLLSERHGASLSRYQPRYTVGATEQGVTYDLVVGPFANANDARQVCAELAASATPCSLQAFRGDAL